MQDIKKEFTDKLLIETSWEVCNKIGGIYTVLSTKAAELKKQFGDNLIFIGPDIWTAEKPSPVFVERKSLLKSASSKLKLPDGLSIRVGRWAIPGNPIAVLVKYDSLIPQTNNIFGQMWEDFKVDSLHAYGDYSVSCAFAVAAAKVIEALVKHLRHDESKVLTHFDEWTTGMGLLYVKKHLPKAATIFTTHATSIGRSICSNGKPLYDYFTGYHGDQMALELNMEAKHSLEKTAAHQADCFTTVSEVTAAECSQLLGITPQVITPNGFNSDFVPRGKKYNEKREAARKRIIEVASALSGKDFAPETFIVATSGRNEYRNKGLDLFIDSMIRIGNLKTFDRPVLALILVPGWVSTPNQTLLEKLNGDSNNHNIWPNFSTHRLNNEDGDAVFLRLLELCKQESKVTFMYVPCYLDGNDGVLNFNYYDLLTAIDATTFPSYYEPWGYTPLESLAFGIPTITSDKSGFGQWIADNFKNGFQNCGVEVIERNDSNYDNAADSIARCIEQIAEDSQEDIKAFRKSAEATAQKASWSLFIKYYFEAFNFALQRADKRNRNVKF